MLRTRARCVLLVLAALAASGCTLTYNTARHTGGDAGPDAPDSAP